MIVGKSNNFAFPHNMTSRPEFATPCNLLSTTAVLSYYKDTSGSHTYSFLTYIILQRYGPEKLNKNQYI